MSWTRSATMRAGVAGAASAALALSLLPASAGAGTAPAASVEARETFALAAAELPLPDAVSPEEVAAAEAARLQLRASRAKERADRAAAEQRAKERAKKRRQAKQAAEQAAAEQAAAEQAAADAAAAAAVVVGERWTTTGLNVRTAPGGSVITVLASGTKVAITDRVDGGWRQIKHSGRNAWVSDQYLSTSKPAASTPSAPSAPSTAACQHGSSIESGLTANARAVYRAVCGRWPQITSYGGYRPSNDYHGSGRAVDIMVSGQLGWDVANYVRANAGSLGVSEVIYAQRIWTVQRSAEGWRGMSDRGSATANHYDHVHVSVY